MPRTDSHQDLRQKLEAVETRISHHLFQLPGIAESLRIVDQSTGKDADAVLTSRGPAWKSWGRKQLRTATAWPVSERESLSSSLRGPTLSCTCTRRSTLAPSLSIRSPRSPADPTTA